MGNFKNIFTGFRFRLLLVLFVSLIPLTVLMIYEIQEDYYEKIQEKKTKAAFTQELIAYNVKRYFDNTKTLLTTLAYSNEIRNINPEQTNLYLAQIIKNNPNLHNIGIVNSEGIVVSSALPNNSIINVSDKDWYIKLKKSKAFTIGNYQIGKITKKPGINVAIPLPFQDTSKPLTAVFAAINLDDIAQHLSKMEFNQDVIVNLLDDEGIIISRSEENLKYSGKPSEAFKNSSNKLNSFSEVPSIDSKRRIWRFIEVPETNKSLVLGTGFSYDDIYNEAIKQIVFNFLFLLFTFAFSIFFGFIIVNKYLSRPLKKISSTSKEFASGNRNLRFQNDTNIREIKELSDSFNSMADALDKYSTNLENLVDERTKELEIKNLSLLSEIENRKNTELSLIESERKLLESQEMANLGSWELDIDTGIFTFNDNFYKIFHTNAEEMGGYKIPINVYAEKFLYHEDSILVEEENRKAIETNDSNFSRYLEHRINYFDGGIGYIGVRFFVSKDSNGKTVKTFGVNQDITQRKMIENELRIAIDKAQENNRINEARLRLIKFSEKHSIDDLLEETLNEAELLSNSKIGFFHFVDPDQKSLTLQNWSTQTKAHFCLAVGKGEHYSIEKAGVWVDCVYESKPVIHNNYHELKHKKGLPEGHADVIRELVVPIIYDGTIKAIMGVGNKPTEYDEHDIEKISLLAYLAWEIIEKKRVFEALQIAKDKAEESDKLKTAFLQNMSHEIRTPLNVILGFSNLLTDDSISQENLIEYTDIIKKSSHRLMETVGNILDISKIETGQVDLNLKECSLNSLIQNQYSLFRFLAESKGIKLSFYLDMNIDEVSIETDEFKLNQILTNLINNAIKFTFTGEIKFGYMIKGDKLEFFVKDTGVGIPQDLKHRIFTRFAQADLSISRGYEGVGLGLSICKGLVGILGGEIWYESIENQGTTFYFTIPFKEINHIDNYNANKSNNLVKSDLKMLLAEDDWASYQFIDRILKKSGIEYYYAKNGIEAINIVEEHPDINFVLMDIKMPKMNGVEAAKKIKELHPELTIIAQTAYASIPERDEILSVGFNDYISKPIIIEELINVIKKYSK